MAQNPPAKEKEFFKRGTDPTLLATPQEKPLYIKTERKHLIIGIPRERHWQEKRVALTPRTVKLLASYGHEVMVEHNAGEPAHFLDQEYIDNGALIVYAPEEIYNRANVIVKIAPLVGEELEYLQKNQTVISALHLGAVRPDYLQTLMEKSISAFAFEFIQARDGSYPLMQMMSEIAGITSITVASELLSGHTNGKGMLLGGVTGVPPAVVTVVGAGTVGYHATKTALALGASVQVIDREVYKLRKLEQTLHKSICTAVSQPHYVSDAVRQSEVVIGAAFDSEFITPCVVTEEMVMQMRHGSVIVDVAIDQGGCVETSRITSHDEPTFIRHGVIHYCVPNIASRVPRTASAAISNVLAPMILKMGEAGSINNLFANEVEFRTGIYVYHRHVTKRLLANMFNMDYMDIELLYAANI